MGLLYGFRKYFGNSFCYRTTSDNASEIKQKKITSESIKLMLSALKNEGVLRNIEQYVGILNDTFSFPIYQIDSHELTVVEYSKAELLTFMYFLLENNYLSRTEMIGAYRVISAASSDFLENHLGYPACGKVSYREILDYFDKDFDILNDKPLGLDATELAGVLEREPFNIKLKKNSRTIFDRLPSYADRKNHIFLNILNFKYKYDYDDVANYHFINSTNFDEYAIISDELKNEIMSEIPDDFTLTQKLYYIYRRLCQIVTYDEKYYIGNQRRIYDINHQNINRIPSISLNNNIVVCTEIAVILAAFCKELNLPYKILNNDRDAKTYNYGKEHLCIEVKIGDYFIKMDPTTGLINSDIALEKTRGYVNSFWIMNKTLRTQDNFSKELLVVDDYIKSKTKELGYDKIINNTKITSKVEGKDLNFRLKLFVDCIVNCHLSRMDSLRYFLDLKRDIFAPDYEDCVGLQYRSKEHFDYFKSIPTLVIVVVYNEDGLSDNLNNNKYICIMDKEVKYLNFLEFTALNLKGVDSYRDADYEDEEIERR